MGKIFYTIYVKCILQSCSKIFDLQSSRSAVIQNISMNCLQLPVVKSIKIKDKFIQYQTKIACYIRILSLPIFFPPTWSKQNPGNHVWLKSFFFIIRLALQVMAAETHASTTSTTTVFQMRWILVRLTRILALQTSGSIR